MPFINLLVDNWPWALFFKCTDNSLESRSRLDLNVFEIRVRSAYDFKISISHVGEYFTVIATSSVALVACIFSMMRARCASTVR